MMTYIEHHSAHEKVLGKEKEDIHKNTCTTTPFPYTHNSLEINSLNGLENCHVHVCKTTYM